MELLTQLLLNGVVNGCHYALLGISFGLILGTTRIVHFAYGPLAALGAYLCWWLATALGLPLILAVLLAAALSACIGGLCWRWLYRPFEREKSSGFVILIASLGFFIIMENVIGLVFGSDTKAVSNAPTGILDVGGAIVTSVQLLNVLVLTLVGAALAWFVTRTRFGRALLAMSDNPEMAAVVGIDTSRIVLMAFGLGSAIASVAASLVLLRDGAQPHMGFHLVFTGFVAVVIGGLGSLRGAAIGGLVLGLVESVGMWRIPSEWQSSVAFVLLFLVLLVRPQGIFGGRK